MTKEEAIKTLKENVCLICAYGGKNIDECDIRYCDNREAFNIAIKALENQKTGHWIKHENPNLGQCMKISYECSNCKVWVGCEYFIRKSYCTNCGAKMEGE